MKEFEKPKLIILEGFDRTGKDSLLKLFDQRHEDDSRFEAYFQYVPKDIPKYREQPNEFRQWLITWIGNQVDDLIDRAKNGAKTQMIVRLLLTDKVYSTLFNREEVVDRYHDKVFSNFQVKNCIFLFKDYNEYLKRLQLIGDDFIEYSEEEFYKVNEMYVSLSKFFEEKGAKTQIFYIEGDKFLNEYLDEVERI